MLLHFVILWPWPLTFHLIFIDGRGIAMDYFCAQWCAKYYMYFQNSILFWKYKIVFYFVFLKYSYQCILFCIFKILFSSILLFSKYFFENTFCKGQTKGKLISDRDPQLLMSLSSEIRSFQCHYLIRVFYFVFSKYYLGVFCTSLIVDILERIVCSHFYKCKVSSLHQPGNKPLQHHLICSVKMYWGN